MRRVLTLAAAIALLSAPAFATADSTTAPHLHMPWQAPNSRAIGGIAACPPGQALGSYGGTWTCTDTISHATTADEAMALDSAAVIQAEQVLAAACGGAGIYDLSTHECVPR